MAGSTSCGDAVGGDNQTLNLKVNLDFNNNCEGSAGSLSIIMTEFHRDGGALSNRKRQE